MKKFRLKSELIWMKKGEGVILYYGNKRLNTEISTENNSGFFAFCQFIALPRTKQEIIDYTGLSRIEKDDIIFFLEKKRYAYWENDPQNELTRTDLFINTFPGILCTDFNKKIKDKRIIIIGLGTAGSYLIEVLSKLNFTNFFLIDGDRVEEKNLVAQNYLVDEIGTYKVEALAKRYNKMCQVKKCTAFISDYESLNRVVGGIDETDIIINAADDHQLMLSLTQAKVENKFSAPIIVTGYGVLAQTAYLITDSQTAEKFISSIHSLLINKSDAIVENSGSVLNAFLGAYMVSKMLLDFLLGKAVASGYVNIENNDSYVESVID